MRVRVRWLILPTIPICQIFIETMRRSTFLEQSTLSNQPSRGKTKPGHPRKRQLVSSPSSTNDDDGKRMLVPCSPSGGDLTPSTTTKLSKTLSLPCEKNCIVTSVTTTETPETNDSKVDQVAQQQQDEPMQQQDQENKVIAQHTTDSSLNSINPTLASFWNNKGVIYIQQRQYAKAKLSLNQALSIATLKLYNRGNGAPHEMDLGMWSMDNNCSAAPNTCSIDYLTHLDMLAQPPTNDIAENSVIAVASTTNEDPSLSFDREFWTRDFALTLDEAQYATNNCKVCLFSTCEAASNEQSNGEPCFLSGSYSEDAAYHELGTAEIESNLEHDLPAGDLENEDSFEQHDAMPENRLHPCQEWTHNRPEPVNKHRAEYDEGMDYFRNPLPLEDHSKHIDCIILFNLARVYHNQNDYDEALAIYRRAWHKLEHGPQHDGSVGENEETKSHNKNGDEGVLALAILFGIGQIQYIRGDYNDSLLTYTNSLNIARIKFGPSSLEAAACMNCVGVLHYIMPKGSSVTALHNLKACIRVRVQHLGEDHIDVGTTWNNIGRIYFQQSRYDKAMEAYQKALMIRRFELWDSVDVAATIFNIGQVYHQLGERDRALRDYHEFLRLAKQHFGDYHRDVCIVTTCIGQVYHEKKDFQRAHHAFLHALLVGRVALGKIHPEIAITLNKLGNLHYESGELELALKAYNEGLEVELSVLDNGNPNICVTYTNIAEIHKQRMEYDKALESYEKVLEIQRQHGASPLDIANTLSSIGYARHQKGDYQGAMDVNQECLRIRREIKGDVDEDVATTLTHIALVLIKMDMHDMALQVLSEAYRIRVQLGRKESRDVAFTLYNIALIYHHQGSYERALTFYSETARVETCALGGSHRDLSITYYNIGQIYYQRGYMDLALQNFNHALQIERSCFGETNPTCARTLNEIGNIHLQLGNIQGLMDAFTEALRIYRQANVPEDNLIIYGKSLWRLECVQPEAAGAA